MKVIAFISMKGGVGKTTAAVNVAYHAASEGHRTLIWDLDPQGAASYALRVRPRLKGGANALVLRRRPVQRFLKGSDFDGLDLLPADFSERHIDLMLDNVKRRGGRVGRLLRDIRRDYDLVVIDCPPGGGLSIEGAVEASSLVVSPTVPTPLAVRTVEQTRALVEDHTPFRTFLSMVDGRKRLHRDLRVTLHNSAPELLSTEIPNSSIIERMAETRLPVAEYAPRSPAAAAFLDLWQELEKEIF